MMTTFKQRLKECLNEKLPEIEEECEKLTKEIESMIARYEVLSEMRSLAYKLKEKG